MSIHISAKQGEVADTVLLPGDPLRGQGIAESLLENVNQYSRVRGMLGFTGEFNGQKVSVQGTGMGMPSTAIYVNELIDLGAKRLIRVGTCGSFQPDINIGDVVIAMSASTDSSMNRHVFEQKDFAPTANFSLLEKAVAKAREMGLSTNVGNILSSDSFYNANPDHWKKWAEYGVLAVEMESSAIYTIAAKRNIEALTILTVSDSLVTGDLASIEDRQNNFMTMAKIALSLA
jgi:purine-nucleoside phosphorylase